MVKQINFKKEKRIATVSIILLFLILNSGCIDKKSKKKLFGRNSVCHNVWREKYTVFSGGAYSAELYSDYITDSVNFRVYIGSHDEYSGFEYTCNGDTLFVRKFKINEDRNKSIVENSIFRLSVLRKEHRFE
jgi:hypothetical protein